MKTEYSPNTLRQKLGYLIEKCGEVLYAANRVRWGTTESYNPDVPAEERETNREWLLRELKDLRRAMHLIEEELHDPK